MYDAAPAMLVNLRFGVDSAETARCTATGVVWKLRFSYKSIRIQYVEVVRNVLNCCGYYLASFWEV
jgi:hypothetical protein